MTNKISSGLFFILFSGLVVSCFLSSSVFAGTPAPLKISSSSEREVRVCLKTQRFGFYERGQLIFSGTICSGMKGHETPKGSFRVLTKARNYYSRKYNGAAMPFAVQFTRDGHFLHVGEIRHRPSSHGCVRLYQNDAERIFSLAKIGDAVTIE
jgi:lipoprotein-anchoring transpeptidase ErfK/SrfK